MRVVSRVVCWVATTAFVLAVETVLKLVDEMACGLAVDWVAWLVELDF